MFSSADLNQMCAVVWRGNNTLLLNTFATALVRVLLVFISLVTEKKKVRESLSKKAGCGKCMHRIQHSGPVIHSTREFG